jgi:hypothetical protein
VERRRLAGDGRESVPGLEKRLNKHQKKEKRVGISPRALEPRK